MIALLLAAAAAGRFVELGPGKAQRDSAVASLDFPFIARADEHLTGAAVRLAFDAPVAEGVEVLVNDERVALLSAAEMAGTRELPVAREMLADRNQLTLRLLETGGRCGSHPGAWQGLRSAGVVLQADPVPFPDELALLPLPFFDRGYDAQATIPVALAHAPTLAEARLAALLAGWFAVDAPIPLSFVAQVGALPDASALVLVAGEEDAARFGVPAPQGPSVRMMDHPAHPGSNVKLLVVGGRDLAELRGAVESLASGTQRLSGSLLRLPPAPARPAAPPYSAPRWIPADRAVPFSQYPEHQETRHEGTAPATLSMRFRIAPDLFIWPADSVALDLGWTELLPRGTTAPRLDVEMNGYFLATLPARPQGRARLRIPREHMRGFNQLLVHVRYPGQDPCAPAPASGAEPPRVSIDGASTLHVEGLPHFASLPDVSLFAFDGFPFTRFPDLAETAVVLPEHPQEAELSMALSIFGQLAQFTGRVGDRARFASAPVAGKDLLVIGPLPHGWGALLPIGADGQVREREPALDLLGGIGPLLDARRASSTLQGARGWAAIESIESPVSPGHTAVVVTGTSLPAYSDFLGYAKSTGGSPDLLLLTGGQRFLFRIGPGYGSGHIGAWTRLRWFFATHWIALLPLLFAGVAALSWQGRHFLARRMRERLALGAAAAVLLGAIAAQAAPRCGSSAPWPQWQRYVESFVSPDGRVIDRTSADRTTSEGQSYALFFALVANDPALFARVLDWTAKNLTPAGLAAALPAWEWGRRRDGRWGVRDANSASDSDLWIAYALLEAGRLWSEPRYTALSQSVLANVAAREVKDLPGLGPMLLPGPEGFRTAHGVRLNPSYQPPQLLKRFASAQPKGPWSGILQSSQRMLAAVGNVAADWVLYDPRRGFAVDPVKGATGSYDAVRVYLWLGMDGGGEGPRALLGLLPQLPEKIDARSLRTQGSAPIGFYGALLPLAQGDPRARAFIEQKLAAAEQGGLYGNPPAYYDQNLILFGRGYVEGRFHFTADGALAPAWETQCLGRAR